MDRLTSDELLEVHELILLLDPLAFDGWLMRKIWRDDDSRYNQFVTFPQAVRPADAIEYICLIVRGEDL